MKDKRYAFVVMMLIILPNLYYIIRGRESFPFTQAPMFAHYVGNDTRFFSFHFILDRDSVQQEIQPEYNVKMPVSEICARRFFFNNIYGSAEAASPFGHFRNDSRQAFENRMGLYFKAFFKPYLSVKDTRIWVDVFQYDRQYNFKEKHTIGYYDCATDRFVHTWESTY